MPNRVSNLGSIILPDGTKFVAASDGVIKIFQQDGSITTAYPDGRIVDTYPPDQHGVIQSITQNLDGSTTSNFQGSDYYYTRHPDGTTKVQKPDGSITTFDQNYQPIARQTPDGTTMVKQPDGSYHFNNAIDGTSGIIIDDGDSRYMTLTVQGQPAAYQSHVLPDGTITTQISAPSLNYQVNQSPDGSVDFDSTEGGMSTKGNVDSQGNVQMQITDHEGNTLQRRIGADGSLHDKHSCGSYLISDASGSNLQGKIMDQGRTITFDQQALNVTLDNGLQKTVHHKQPDGSYSVDIRTPDGKMGTRTYAGDGSGSFQQSDPHSLFDNYNNSFSE